MKMCLTGSDLEEVSPGVFGFMIDLPFQQGQAYQIDAWSLGVYQDTPAIFVDTENHEHFLPVSVSALLIPLSGKCEVPNPPCCAAVDSLDIPAIVVGCGHGFGMAANTHFFQQKAFIWLCGVEAWSNSSPDLCLTVEIKQVKMTAAMERQLIESLIGPCPVVQN